MKVTPDIIRCEFIGSELKVVKSTSSCVVGIKGKVIDETRNTFTILQDSKRKRIVKDISTFHFKFPDGTVMEVDGKLIVGRPEDRLKKCIRRLW
ncbi:MAG: ribonuclease P protein component 1 [Candidatus Bathyarchaeota archaeon]|nr:ribonuclease P protein component 1 [Candidatus Bathyarchaeota archaeon]MCX8176902.1 ribonuclease P protein component 1 [Candidatus Bathyarchaeota archaeon]MDW8193411.1 ribonuclease P protein component 1 [Nitrososphaerota archaeon]